MKISLIIPLYNEKENIKSLLDQIYAALKDIDYEVIFVDDGSIDNSAEEIKKYANARVRLLVFQKNYGQTQAMAAGIEAAVGEYIVTMDGDLQNDPSDILPMLLKAEKEDWDLIAGKRKQRQDSLFGKKIPSWIANRMIRKLSGIRISDYGCSLKLFKSRIAKNLGLYGDLHRFIPILAAFQGARITEIEVKHHPRIHGKSKYGFSRTYKVISDLLFLIFMRRYMQRPMHLFGSLGIFTFLTGTVINIYFLILKIQGEDIWRRPLLLLGIVLLILGVQLIFLGIIAELIMRTYYESQNKKSYIIKEIFIASA
jgi:glycosyltransferase involved in cell wall biosynthesis